MNQNDLHSISRHSHRIHVTSISTYNFWSFFDFLCQISKVNIPPHGSYFKGYLHMTSQRKFRNDGSVNGTPFSGSKISWPKSLEGDWSVKRRSAHLNKRSSFVDPKNWKVNKQLRKERRRHKNSKCNSIQDQILGVFSLNIPIHRIHVWLYTPTFTIKIKQL